MFVRGGRLALALVAVVLVLTGCGGGGSKPVSLPTLPPTSSSPTPTATGTADQLAAVSAVVRSWFALLAGSTTLQTASAIDQITAASCKCRNASRSIRDAVAKHETYVGTSRIRSFVPSMDGMAAAEVLVEYDYSDGGLRGLDGHYVSRVRGRTYVEANFRLQRISDRWVITAIETIHEGQLT